MVQIDEKGRLIQEEEVSTFELSLQIKLPDSYRRFLLAYNGGVPVPEIVDIDGMSGSPSDVQVFFGLDRGAESSNLAWNNQVFPSLLLEHGLLPIACDSGGNLFCLAVSGMEEGKVFYCAMDTEDTSIYLVAPDFAQFLQKFRSWS